MSEGKKSRALGIFSGGLDSMLAVKLLERAGVEAEVVTFATPFFSPERAIVSAKHIGAPLQVVDVGQPHLALVKDPPHGYGSNMNPCIDCHAFMFAQAGKIMAEQGFDFLFSGEVLGQRPMSQNKQALAQVAKLSGMAEYILRPLSAQVLPVSPVEERGLVEREMLLGLSGRGRKPQMALATEWGISDYPAPAGGCLLTEPGFSRRLKDLWTHQPDAGLAEVELLKHGRHLRLSPAAKLIVGRNQRENQILESLAPPSAHWLITQGLPGPLGLYFGPADGPDLELAAALVAGYGKAKPGQVVSVQVDRRDALEATAQGPRLAAAYLL